MTIPCLNGRLSPVNPIPCRPSPALPCMYLPCPVLDCPVSPKSGYFGSKRVFCKTLAFSALVCFAHGLETTICCYRQTTGVRMACTSLAAHYLPCRTYLNAGGTALARHIGTALASPCPAWLSPCRSFLSSFFCRSLTATQNTPPSRQPHLFRSQTGHTVSLLLYVTISYCRLL